MQNLTPEQNIPEQKEQNKLTIQQSLSRLLAKYPTNSFPLDQEVVEPLSVANAKLSLSLQLTERHNTYLVGQREIVVNVITINLNLMDNSVTPAEVIGYRYVEINTCPPANAIASRLHDLVKNQEVVLISSSVHIFKSDYEGKGYGQALLQASPALINLGLERFDLKKKKVIFAYVTDVAAPTQQQNLANPNQNSRKGWSTFAAQQIGFSTNNAEEYLGESILREQPRNLFLINVLKDDTLDSPVNI
jgi:hypothetical protein